MLRLGSRSIWRLTATSSGAVPGPAPRVRSPPPNRLLAGPSRAVPSRLSGAVAPSASGPNGLRPWSCGRTGVRPRARSGRLWSLAALIRREGAQRGAPFRPGRGGLGVVVAIARRNLIRGSVGRSRRRACRAEKGWLYRVGLGSLTPWSGGRDLEGNEGAGPRGQRGRQERGGGRTERWARSPSRCSGRPGPQRPHDRASRCPAPRAG